MQIDDLMRGYYKYKTIYLDNASTTKLDELSSEVVKVIFDKYWYNPSGLYTESVKCHQILENCIEEIKESLGCHVEDDIIFTSSGSASNSLALDVENFAICYDPTSHSSVIKKMEYYKRKGKPIYKLCVDKQGFIDEECLLNVVTKAAFDVDNVTNSRRKSNGTVISLKHHNIIVSVCGANNENGTIQNIKSIKESLNIVKRKIEDGFSTDINIYLHVDGTQLIADRCVKVNELGIDMLTLSGHKIGCPSGIGMLYISKDLKDKLTPLVFGEQQDGLFAGTENLAYIVLFANALVDYNYNRDLLILNEAEIKMVRDKYLKTRGNIEELQSVLYDKIIELGYAELVGANLGQSRLKNHLSFMFHGFDAETLVKYLDFHDIKCSTGSACNSFEKEPSNVLLEMGYTPTEAYQVVRFTLNKDVSVDDLDKVVTCIKNFKKIYT